MASNGKTDLAYHDLITEIRAKNAKSAGGIPHLISRLILIAAFMYGSQNFLDEHPDFITSVKAVVAAIH